MSRDYRIFFPTMFLTGVIHQIYLLTTKVTDKKKSACTYGLWCKISANFECEHVLPKNSKSMKYRMLTNNRKYSSHIQLPNKLPIFPNCNLFLTKRKKTMCSFICLFFLVFLPQNNSATLWLFSSGFIILTVIEKPSSFWQRKTKPESLILNSNYKNVSCAGFVFILDMSTN